MACKWAVNTHCLNDCGTATPGVGPGEPHNNLIVDKLRSKISKLTGLNRPFTLWTEKGGFAPVQCWEVCLDYAGQALHVGVVAGPSS